MLAGAFLPEPDRWRVFSTILGEGVQLKSVTDLRGSRAKRQLPYLTVQLESALIAVTPGAFSTFPSRVQVRSQTDAAAMPTCRALFAPALKITVFSVTLRLRVRFLMYSPERSCRTSSSG